MNDFLRNFLQKTRQGKKDPETRYTVQRDKWDRKVVDSLDKEMKEYILASKDLGDFTPTGYEAMADTLLSLFKANPHLKDGNNIRPSYAVNRKVMEEMNSTNEFEDLHATSAGDPISAGLAASLMEPELESLFEALGDEVNQAQSIEEQLQSFEEMADDANDLADKLANSDLTPEEAQNFQANLDALNEQLDNLQDSIESQSQNLEDALNDKSHEISQGVQNALSEAKEQSEALDQAENWGFGKGDIRKLNPSARIALADKLASPKFTKMAEVFGRMQNIAISKQLDKSTNVPEEIYDLGQGNDLARVIPTEIAFAGDDVLVYDFLRRYTENNLIQYSLRGKETINKGGIILLEDGSGSMKGDREIWSKAIGLALLKVAQMQNRPFHAIQFSGSGMYLEFNFDTSSTPLEMQFGKQTLHGLEAVIKFAEAGLSGGTDFMTPLARALEILSKDFEQNGSTEADIVFLTDGQCGVPESFIKDFKAEQERMDFKIYGVAIQTNPHSEPFYTICDGNVIGLAELMDPNELGDLFKGL